MVQIDKANRHQRCSKEEQENVLKTDTIYGKQQQAQKAGQAFHDGIAQGDAMTAVSAFPHEEQIAQQRDVVVKPDSLTAVGARRRGMDDRLFLRNAIDAYVRETPQTESKKEGKDLAYCPKIHLTDPWRRYRHLSVNPLAAHCSLTTTLRL